MRQEAVVALALLTLSPARAALAGTKMPSDANRLATKALAFFDAAAAASIPEFLGRLRPEPISPAVRALVIASLPRQGELRPTAAEQTKLAAVAPVLDFHSRNGVIEVKVIDVGHAFVGLHARTVLLISRDALALVTPEELQALAAHEMGHEYLWNEYQVAMGEGASDRLQELELVCDGIAILTLRALGLDQGRLASAVTKVTRHNERLGATATASFYVSLGERRRFIAAVSERLSAPVVVCSRCFRGDYEAICFDATVRNRMLCSDELQCAAHSRDVWRVVSAGQCWTTIEHALQRQLCCSFEE